MEKSPPSRPQNRLKDESSPYLRQHQHNPVDWYPWGQEAFARARDEDKPILLSIGYSACHWCHVMAHESFEDDETAAQMNRDFINIKVDREEHPDVDQVYQHALNLFDQHGGWPLTMFLLPTGEPFFGGTYFPPREAYGRPSFRRVMSALHNAYRTQRGDVGEQAQKLVAALGQIESRGAASSEGAELPSDVVKRVSELLASRIDRQRGGFAGAPKFPNPTSLSLFLRAFAKDRAMETAYPTLLTLSAMGEGGIYDHVGGGFARYSTDEKWLVPHFEKMLYDNAQLFRLLAESSRIAHELSLPAEGHYAELVAETFGWLEREMRDPSGGLYAAQDADSEGVEGKYFVWSPEEIAAVLPPETATLFCRHYDIVPGGNWNDPHGHGPRGKSIPHIVAEPENPEVKATLDGARAQLLAARRKRVPPGTDDKILCGWNGLCITGLAEAGRLLGDRRYVDAAQRTADFVLSRMRDGSGQLLRTFSGDTAKLPATLDDHAFLAEGLFYLAHATQDFRYFTAMREIMDALLAGFYDAEKRLFFLGPDESAGVKLCTRPVSLHDSAIPSGLSVACLNLLRLAALIDVEDPGRDRYQDIAEKTLRGLSEQALRNPFGLSNLVAAMDLLQNGLVVVVIIDPDSGSGQQAQAAHPAHPGRPSTAGRALLAATTTHYVPDLFTMVAKELPRSLAHHADEKRAVDGKATAYVCRGPRCTAPIHDAQELATRLISP